VFWQVDAKKLAYGSPATFQSSHSRTRISIRLRASCSLIGFGGGSFRYLAESLMPAPSPFSIIVREPEVWQFG